MELADKIRAVTDTDASPFCLIGNFSVNGVWHDEDGRGYKYSYELTPRGDIINRRGTPPPDGWVFD